MPYGLPYSEEFIEQLDEKDLRDEFVADQVGSHIALTIRTLREQEGWSQTELGKRAGKPQSVISRIEDPDYGSHSLQTLLAIAAALELPLRVDIPQWDEWLRWSLQNSKAELRRDKFNADRLTGLARAARDGVVSGDIASHELWSGKGIEPQTKSVSEQAFLTASM